MAGIPSCEGVRAPRWLVRVLLRMALFVGLVVTGWLLGSTSAMAQDDSGATPPQTFFAATSDTPAMPAGQAPANVLDAAPALGQVVSEAVPETVTNTLDRVLPAPSLPAPDLDAVLPAPVRPALAPALPSPQAPAPAAQTAPRPAAPLAGPVHPAAPAHPTLVAPQRAPVVAAPTVLPAPAGQVDDPAPASGPDVDRSWALIPMPAAGAGLSGPASSTGGATTHTIQSVTLDDHRGAASEALARRPSYAYVDGLPSRHTRRPSTSPD